MDIAERCIGVPDEGGSNMDNGFMAYIQAFIDFVLKIIAIFKSNDDNTDPGNKAKK